MRQPRRGTTRSCLPWHVSPSALPQEARLSHWTPPMVTQDRNSLQQCVATKHLQQCVEAILSFHRPGLRWREEQLETELCRCPLVNHKLKLGRLFDRQFGRISALQYLANVGRCAPPDILDIGALG